ncbi:MAG: hypothetical protein H7Y22_03055 [Gemmatimonadaceae bacterium]|nr:hypothetical protein [Gloeobacterales cyanobacterium ES-bin-141]
MPEFSAAIPLLQLLIQRFSGQLVAQFVGYTISGMGNGRTVVPAKRLTIEV